MKIKHFVNEYTHSKTTFKNVWDEVIELSEELIPFNKKGVKEEFSDVIVLFQTWLWFKLNLNQNLWKLGKPSYKKFINRRAVWEELYIYTNLKKKCTICKNYNREWKVIKHLTSQGISELKSREAYMEVIMKK